MEGEQGFRQREIQMIDELTQLTDVVVATGGARCCEKRTAEHCAIAVQWCT
ncbi:hypothetical protein HAALTHF_54090n [Vreelandella aquamarina]|nr:hypothetical protein HAALTHF_54090n [Halomonas axialensis]